MSKSKLKIGVIGCGTVANIGHLPVYHKSPLVEITAIADPLESHIKQVQERYHIPEACNRRVLFCYVPRAFSFVSQGLY